MQIFARNFFSSLTQTLASTQTLAFTFTFTLAFTLPFTSTLAQTARARADIASAPLPSSLPQLPAFDGEFSGDFLAPNIAAGGNGLSFHWHIVAESPAGAPGVRRARLDVTGHGAHIAATAELDLASGVTHWKIESAEADLAEAFPVITSLLPPDSISSFAGLGIAGKLAVSGDGSVDTTGNWTANLAADIRDATLRNDAQGWLAEGVSARVEFPALPSLKTGAAQTQPVAIRRFSHNATQLTLDDVRTTFSMDESGAGNASAGGANAGGALRIRVGGVDARAADGTISVGAFDFTPSAPAVATTVRVRDIESGNLTHLLSGTVSEARGRFNGSMALLWNPTDGLQFGKGRLLLQKADGTMLRLAPTPGFFTSNMDSHLYFLPPSFGFLRNWLSLKNPAYNTLKEIENGKQPIRVENITITFAPDGDKSGRTATVLIEAKPTNPKSAIQHLRINVNVSGPLAKVIQMLSLSTDQMQISF